MACPVSFSKRDLPPWWSKTLTDLKKKVRRVFNECYQTKHFKNDRVILNENKKAIKYAKRNSWKGYCESIEFVKDSSRLSKILSRDHSCRTLVKREDGEWAETSEDSLTILVNNHFPENSITPSDIVDTSRQVGLLDASLESILSVDRITRAINSFSPFKSPGSDDILPVMPQKTSTSVVPVLKEIYLDLSVSGSRPCLAAGKLMRLQEGLKSLDSLTGGRLRVLSFRPYFG